MERKDLLKIQTKVKKLKRETLNRIKEFGL
jgi:hypothetical protein